MHIYIYSYFQIFIYSYLHMYIYTYLHIYIYTYVQKYIYIYIYLHLYICTFLQRYIYTYIHMYLYTYPCKFIRNWVVWSPYLIVVNLFMVNNHYRKYRIICWLSDYFPFKHRLITHPFWFLKSKFSSLSPQMFRSISSSIYV